MLLSTRRREPPGMTLEGVLGPNDRLDRAPAIPVEAPEALCVTEEGALLASSGARVLALREWQRGFDGWAEFERPVTALAAGPGGVVAVGLSGGSIAVRDAGGGPAEGWPAPDGLTAINDCAFLSSDELLLVDSGVEGTDFLARATWETEGTGRLLSLSRDGRQRILGEGLRCPMSVCLDAKGRPVLPLFERASVIDSSGEMLRSGYPAYLGRLRRTARGYALACLSRRDPLIEFLKQEPGFIAEMKSRIAPRHWIAPRPSPEFSHEFPIELGAARLFGEVKPWAPSFSYGLVIELDEGLMPVAAAHSRANGQRHAVSDVVEWRGRLLAVSRASGEILDLGPGSRRE